MLRALGITLLWVQNLFASEIYKVPLCTDDLDIDHSYCTTTIPGNPKDHCDTFATGRNALELFGSIINQEKETIKFKWQSVANSVEDLVFCAVVPETHCLNCEESAPEYSLFSLSKPMFLNVGGLEVEFFWGFLFKEETSFH